MIAYDFHFFIYQKSLAETEMGWDFKLLCFLFDTDFGYPGIWPCLWQELLLLMLLQFTLGIKMV